MYNPLPTEFQPGDRVTVDSRGMYKVWDGFSGTIVRKGQGILGRSYQVLFDELPHGIPHPLTEDKTIEVSTTYLQLSPDLEEDL